MGRQIQVNKQENLEFLSDNYVQKGNLYEKRSCCSNCSKKKICCFSCLGCILLVLLVIGGAAIYIFCRPNPFEDPLEMEALLTSVPLSEGASLVGNYTLVAYDEHYETYLRSMGIPTMIVPLILMATETLDVKVTETGAEVTTITDWSTRKITYDFGKEFNMSYGRGAGTMFNVCERPQPNVIHCKSEEREKKWSLSSQMEFYELGIVNKRVFLNKNIGKMKCFINASLTLLF